MNTKLFVGNINFDVKDVELEELFKTAGKVVRGEIVRFMTDKKSKGFGFVTMETEADAKNAVEKLNGAEFRGRNIVVNEARQPA